MLLQLQVDCNLEAVKPQLMLMNKNADDRCLLHILKLNCDFSNPRGRDIFIEKDFLVPTPKPSIKICAFFGRLQNRFWETKLFLFRPWVRWCGTPTNDPPPTHLFP